MTEEKHHPKLCGFGQLPLAVVGEIGRGELGYKQAQWRYGIQGRSTVQTRRWQFETSSILLEWRWLDGNFLLLHGVSFEKTQY